ncbi:MAG: hypothetical protein JSS35_05600 [Proteobacteria bacterium]|nr:hypothetical protein [Pseudomonadota bacterium]
MQVYAIPSGPTFYQPIQPVRPPAAVTRDRTDADGDTGRVHPTPPPVLGTLIDVRAQARRPSAH